MYKKLKEAREGLHLLLGYVAGHMDMDAADIAAIEDGRRQATNRELARLSRLYGITPDACKHGGAAGEALAALGRPFTELSGIDREAVISLLHLRQGIRKGGCV